VLKYVQRVSICMFKIEHHSIDIDKYLSNETSIAVWQTAVTNLEKLQSIMRMSTGYRIFKVGVRKF